MTRFRLSPLISLAIGLGLTGPLVAQTAPGDSSSEAGVSETDSGARTIYAPEFFQ